MPYPESRYPIQHCSWRNVLHNRNYVALYSHLWITLVSPHSKSGGDRSISMESLSLRLKSCLLDGCFWYFMVQQKHLDLRMKWLNWLSHYIWLTFKYNTGIFSLYLFWEVQPLLFFFWISKSIISQSWSFQDPNICSNFWTLPCIIVILQSFQLKQDSKMQYLKFCLGKT